MNKLVSITTGLAAACLLLGVAARAEDALPGEVDFGTFNPPKGSGEFVEVNVPADLISLAARIVQKQEPDVAQLLNGLKRVHVNVVGLGDDNRDEIQKRVQKVGQDLAGKGWQRIVLAQEKDQNVGVYLKLGDKGAVQGLVAVVMDGKEHAVFVNVVGDIRPEQLAMLGDKLDIGPLKKLNAKEAKAPEKTSEKVEESK